jgi:hypothetical protein
MLMTVAHAIQQPVEDGGRDHGVTSELLAQAERPRFGVIRGQQEHERGAVRKATSADVRVDRSHDDLLRVTSLPYLACQGVRTLSSCPN